MSIVFSFFLLFLFLSWKRLDWALMLILAGLPLYLIRFSVLGIPSTLLEGMILIAFTAWLTKNYKEVFGNLKLKIENCLKIKNYKLKIPIRYPFDMEIALLLIIAFISAGVAGFDNAALGILKAYFIEPVMVYILIFNVFFGNAGKPATRQKEFISYIIWPLAASAFIVSAIAILQKAGFLPSPDNFWPRVTGVWTYPNALGLFLGPLILIFLGFAMSLISNLKFQISQQFSNIKYQISKFIFLFATIIFSLASIFFARSEGAMAGILIALAVCIFLMIPLKAGIPGWIRKIGLGFSGVFLLAALFYPLIALKVFPEHKYPDFGLPALNYIYDKAALKDFSGEVRKQQWRETWALMADSPARFIFGTGLSGYKEAVRPYHQEGIFFNAERDPDFRRKIVWFDEKYKAGHWHPVEIYMYPHNLILNFWTELGLPGALLFIWIMFRILKIVILNLSGNLKFEIGNFELVERRYVYVALGIIGAVIAVLVHGIVDVPYFKNDLAVLFWVLIALMNAVQIRSRECSAILQ